MAKVLIVGCGDIGLGLAEVLIAEGHQVCGIKRKALPKDLPGLELIRANITLPKELKDLPTDFDQVVLILTPDARDEASYRRVYLEGINNLLAHFANCATSDKPQARWLFVSSTSVYGQNAGEWVDEESETVPVSTTGMILLEAEKNILVANIAGGKNTVVRFSGIYGPGRTVLLTRVESARPVQYEPPYYTNRIHRDDCVGVLAFLIKQSLAGVSLQSIYLASDNAPVPLGEIVSWLSEALKCSQPPAKEKGKDNINANKRCSNQRLLDLGYLLRFSTYREGYGDLLAGLLMDKA